MHVFRLYVLLVVISLGSTACGRKPAVKYPYLNDAMNQTASLTNAEVQAMNFERTAGGMQNSFGSGGTFAPLYEDRASVTLGKSGVSLQLDIELSDWRLLEAKLSAPEAERIAACRKVCAPNILALATNLQCDPRLINASWHCATLSVRGTMSGEEALALKAAETTTSAGDAKLPN